MEQINVFTQMCIQNERGTGWTSFLCRSKLIENKIIFVKLINSFQKNYSTTASNMLREAFYNL